MPPLSRPGAAPRPNVCNVTRPGPVSVDKNNPSPSRSARFTSPAQAAAYSTGASNQTKDSVSTRNVYGPCGTRLKGSTVHCSASS